MLLTVPLLQSFSFLSTYQRIFWSCTRRRNTCHSTCPADSWAILSAARILALNPHFPASPAVCFWTCSKNYLQSRKRKLVNYLESILTQGNKRSCNNERTSAWRVQWATKYRSRSSTSSPSDTTFGARLCKILNLIICQQHFQLPQNFKI